jgi:hypothetical protein
MKRSLPIKSSKEIKKLVDELKIPYKNILVSPFDIDTKVYPKYFVSLFEHQYLLC